MPAESFLSGLKQIAYAGARGGLTAVVRGLAADPAFVEHVARRMAAAEGGPAWESLSQPERAVWLQRVHVAAEAIVETVTT